ncbi:ribonuclease H-like domain-containing protein [Tanacetum coccineum]
MVIQIAVLELFHRILYNLTGLWPTTTCLFTTISCHQRLLGQHGQSAQIRNSHGSNELGGTRGFTASLGQQIRGLADNQQTRGNSFDTQETNLPHGNSYNTCIYPSVIVGEGHPGSDVLRSLLSSNTVLCNKMKSPMLCHACQLGKHVRLPFEIQGANGRSHQISVDYDETFSLNVKSATIHTFLSLPASRHWPVHQVDVKNAFLHG